MKKYFILYFSILQFGLNAQVNYASFVNPFIGTGGHGHTFPGATVPFGMVQLSPDTRIDGSWDGCSGYHYSDEFIYGFSHTHLSGTGCSDYGDIAILPFDRVENKKAIKEDHKINFDYGGLCEKFNHTNENAEAGYYKVKFENDIVAELTSTTRAGMHRYTFPKGAGADIVLKLSHRDKTIESELKQVDKTHIEGFRRSQAWAQDQHIYFVIEFSSPATKVLGKKSPALGNELGKTDFMTYTFKKLKGKPLLIKVGISTVSIEGARKNLRAEIPHWDFDLIKDLAKASWNKELSKLEVTSTNQEKLTTFYTALYHCMIHPSTASDVDGNYRGRDNKIHHADGYTYYTVFSLWDTFRALHPLLSIIDQKRTNDFIKTFLAQYKDGGRLPVWELSSNETDCMIGYHSVSVIADAYNKGIRNYDAELAITAMQKSANWNHLGLPQYNQNGFLEMGDEHESVSKSLEYSYNNWCIAQMATDMNKASIASEYKLRSKGWMNLFDTKTNFIRPRANGGWLTPFEPREVNNNYTEANAWQYTFFVPHDITSMMNVFGGQTNFSNKLDELFSIKSETLGRDQADITGLIGQYAHGNEPSHHMAYLYVYAAQPWKTQKIIHQIQNEFYKNDPNGLIGNEDCGQMSAWHVMSALGFYQVCPGKSDYALGTPLFERSTIHLENGKKYTLEAKDLSDENFYIKDVKQFYLTHEQIMQGGLTTIQMTNKPIYQVLSNSYKPFPETNVETIYIPAPVINAKAKTFKDSMTVKLETTLNNTLVYEITVQEKTNDSDSNFAEINYRNFNLTGTTKIHAWAVDKEGNKSNPVYAQYFKIPNNWAVKIMSKYNPQYTAGGDEGIIDGLKGDENWRKGGWQGYQSQDFECVIDLKEKKDLAYISASFLQDARAWILMPKKVEYYYSVDGINWTLIDSVKNTVADTDEKVQISNFKSSNLKSISCHYVKVKAYNYGRLPKGHQGYGMKDDNAFIFVDEIEIK
jgi:predicted alpha-1,2-mannosidase